VCSYIFGHGFYSGSHCFRDPFSFSSFFSSSYLVVDHSSGQSSVVSSKAEGGTGVSGESRSITSIAGSVASITGVGNSSGGSVGHGHSGGSVGKSDRGGVGNSDGSGMDRLLDEVGTGLMGNGLVDGTVGGDGAGHSNLGVHGHILEDGLGNVVGTDNGGGLVGGNGGGDVGMGGLSDGVGESGDLGDNLGVGVGLSGRVSKVAAKPVVLDGGAVVSGCPHQIRGSSQRGSQGCGSGKQTSRAGGHQRGEEKEPVHG